jgi:hypothetical protein
MTATNRQQMRRSLSAAEEGIVTVMPSYKAANVRDTRSGTRNQWLALCLLAGVMIPVLTAAQQPGELVTTILKSGLHSIFGGHFFLLTVTEVGSVASESEVTIEFRDAADQRRGFSSSVLARNSPVRARITSPTGSGREQLRVIVKITPLTSGEGSQPIVGLEDIDADSLRIETKPPCAPPSVGGGAEGNCDGGWRVTRIQAASPLD